jgi:uncharacterized protein YaeQ
MALTATIHHLTVALSDVDRGVYETLDLRVARHPSESFRFMMTRVLAYALFYEDGIAFSKGGLSSTDEPPIAIRDATGILLAWIDVGTPSAERLHKASKAAKKVALFTHAPLALVRREASSKPIHRGETIEVWRFEPAFLDALEPKIERSTKLEVLHNGGTLYVTIGASTFEGAIERAPLVVEA